MNRGAVLITVLIIAFLLFALVGTFLFLATNARLINERYHENLIALGLAEAGVDYALWEINYGGEDYLAADGWSGTNPKILTITNFKDNGNIYGNISTSVYNPGTDSVIMISTGSFTSISGPTVSRKIRVLLSKHELFNYAILTANSIDIGGSKNKIDSYDSSKGDYGAEYVENGVTKTNINDDGDIVTNGQGDPAINLHGNVTVSGDANTGPDGTVSMQGSKVSLSGGTDDTAEVYMPSVAVPISLTSSTSLGPLDINKKDDPAGLLTTGNYKYDSLTLSGKGELTLDGNVNLYFTGNPSISTSGQSQIIITDDSNVNIYFDGNVSLSGQGVSNVGGSPSDLTFYGTDTVSNINVAGIGEFYGSFYAPGADYVWISGNSEIYGAVVGNNVLLMGSAEIHFDESLKEIGPTSGYDPYAWQEK